MAIRITENGVVNYENSPDVNRKLFPNLNICGKEIDELAKEIDAKAPAVFSTASGSIASFDNGADNMPLKSCIVSFGPIQEGEGDPSPENVRPISGRTGLSVIRNGSNLIDDSIKFVTATGTSLYIGSNSTGYHLYLPAGTYNFSCVFTSDVRYAAYIKEENGSAITIWNKNSGLTSKSFDLDGGNYRISFYNPAEDGGVSADSVSNIMLNVGDSALSYEPYKGETYSVNWQTEAGTVYGGSLDTVSGKLTVDYFKYSPLSTYIPSQFTSLGTYTRVAYSGAPTKPGVNASFPYTGIYSHGSYDNRIWQGDYPHAFCTDTGVGYFYLPCEATDEAIRAYLKSQEDAGTPVTVAYKIATPIEYQLTPQEIHTLLGDNNIWSEDGDVSVVYPADTKTYIDELRIKTVEVSGQTPTITAEENTRYICGEVTSLTFTPSEKGICDVRFTTASISTVLTLPETVKLPSWFDPTLLEAGTTYEINVLDGIYGVVMSWA